MGAPRPTKQSGAAAAAIAAAMIMEVRKALVISAAPVAVVRPDTTGITERAARLAVRAIALFTPDARLTCLGGHRSHDSCGERRQVSPTSAIRLTVASAESSACSEVAGHALATRRRRQHTRTRFASTRMRHLPSSATLAWCEQPAAQGERSQRWN